MAELKNADLRPAQGMVGMTPESVEQGALRANIVLNWAAVPPHSIDPKAPACADLAAAAAKQFQASVGDVASIHVDGDAGCRFSYATTRARTATVVRFVGNHELVVNWTHMTSLSPAADSSVWNDVLAGLHIPK